MNALQDEVVEDDGFEQHVNTRATTPSKPGSGPGEGGSGNDKQTDEKANDEREREELVSSLKELTRYVS